MTHERRVRRYAAYFKGWCQAFGEHESFTDEASGISWLYNESQIGFILPATLTKALYREVLRGQECPVLVISGNSARVGDVSFVFPAGQENLIRSGIRKLLEASSDPCVFLTSHFMYGTRTRIMTLSDSRPLSIIYKAIGDMRIRLD
jgi:hypothetical protein